MSKTKCILKKSLKISLLLLFVLMLIFSVAATANAAQIAPEASTWSALQETINNAESGDTITLTADVTASGSDKFLSIPDGAVITIDLNGHTIDRAMKENGGAQGVVLQVNSGAMLTITDSSEAASGKITGGYASDGGGIHNIGTLILEGGCIKGNKSDDSGGGIANYGVLVVSGGAVCENTAEDEGGGIFNGVQGYLSLKKEVVYGNKAPQYADIKNLGSMKTLEGETVHYVALKDYLIILAVVPTVVLLMILFFAVGLDNYLDKRQKRIIYIITVLVFTLVIQNYFEYRLSGTYMIPRTILAIIGYSVRPAILALILYLICPDKQYKFVWVAVGANAAIYLTALFSPLAFYFSNGHFHKGPLNYTCLIVSALLFIYCIFMTLWTFRPKKRKETWIPVFALLIISLSVVLDYTVDYHNQPVSFLTIAITISCMMYYIWLHLQYVREHEKALQAEHRIQIMMTQIQPHFIFNTLTAIRALCKKDQKAAVRTIGLFSDYLRQNLESLDQSELIPLSKELEHTRIYTEIEMIRFSNIRVEYDIRDEDYGIPTLTIQPMVENAIRHGVRSRTEGIVKVTAYRQGNEHLIVIKDNGIGFEKLPVGDENGKHIGISNVKERLEQMCGGRMEIDSIPDEGTKITIRIPVSEEMKE